MADNNNPSERNSEDIGATSNAHQDERRPTAVEAKKNPLDAAKNLWNLIVKFGTEDPDSQDFAYWKFIVRALVINLFAGYIAYRMTLEYFPSEESSQLPEADAAPQPSLFDEF